jgi:nicotinate-nucleotide adenylyltransferase
MQQPGSRLSKIGIYGGTFDPIHHGHLILAREAREQLQLETILFVPAATSPFKGAPQTSAADRRAMVEAAVAGEPGFAVDPVELNRPPPSYTIDTVEIVRQREPNAELFYLVGADNVAALPKWHRFADLEKLVQFVVLDRTGQDAEHSYRVVRRQIDISATDIRKRVARGQSIRYLVPHAVEDIIRSRRLYQET